MTFLRLHKQWLLGIVGALIAGAIIWFITRGKSSAPTSSQISMPPASGGGSGGGGNGTVAGNDNATLLAELDAWGKAQQDATAAGFGAQTDAIKALLSGFSVPGSGAGNGGGVGYVAPARTESTATQILNYLRGNPGFAPDFQQWWDTAGWNNWPNGISNTDAQRILNAYGGNYDRVNNRQPGADYGTSVQKVFDRAAIASGGLPTSVQGKVNYGSTGSV